MQKKKNNGCVVCAGVRDKARIGAVDKQMCVNQALRLVRTSTIC